MTLRTNARVAGAAYLIYIAVAFPKPGLDARIETLTTFVSCICALLLAVSLYGITKLVDNEIALLGFAFRLAEGTLGGAAIMTKTSSFFVAGSFFAVGSLFFCYLLYRGRIIPQWMGGLGVTASLIVAVLIPLQMAGFATGRFVTAAWVPMGIFEIIVAVWFLIKGASTPQIQLDERS